MIYCEDCKFFDQKYCAVPVYVSNLDPVSRPRMEKAYIRCRDMRSQYHLCKEEALLFKPSLMRRIKLFFKIVKKEN